MPHPTVTVLVPRTEGNVARDRAWAYVQHWYTQNHPDYQLIPGVVSDTSPWCKARAVAQAARDAVGEVLVVADADCIAPRLPEAVQRVSTGAYRWAIPHHTVHRLSQTATRRVYQGAPIDQFPRTREWYDQFPYVGYAGGGITVIRRADYKNVPLDPNFVGWGQEDEAWAMALRLLCGRPWRPGSAPLWHLWHPPQRRLNRATGSERSRAHLRRYKEARTPGLMDTLLTPARSFYDEITSGNYAS